MSTNSQQRRKILLACASALLLASGLLLAVILPAEYGWDPLGTGKQLGLVGLDSAEPSPLKHAKHRWNADDIAFTLAPFEAVEYKYQLEEGATLVYHWQATGEVLYDMHAEPRGAAPGYAESFEKSRGITASGSYVAPFSGIHGWFWQNRGQRDATVRLSVRGYFDSAVEMRDGREFEYGFGQESRSNSQP